MLFLIAVMATERVAALKKELRFFGSGKCVLRFSFLLTIVALAFSIPVVFPGFPVQIYRFRYLCAIGRFVFFSFKRAVLEIFKKYCNSYMKFNFQSISPCL